MNRFYFLTTCLVLFFSVTSYCQQPKVLSIDEIISHEMDDLERLPFSKWLSDNTLMAT